MPVRNSVADITWDDYARQVQSRDGDFGALSAVAAGQFLCQLYKVNPNAVNQAASLTGVNPDVRSFILDKMCRPQNLLPPPPVAPFQGGQCPLVGYEVRVSYKEAYNFNELILERTQQASELFWGEIFSVNPAGSNLCVNGSLAVKGFGWIDVECRGYYFGQQVPRQKFRLAVKTDNAACIYGVESVQITRIGGQNDICGNPPPSYPIVRSPVNNFSNTVNITNNVDVNLTVPIAIIPTVIAPIGVSVRPEFNVDVGGLNINFGADGVRINNKDPLPPGKDIGFDPRIDFPDYYDNSSVEISGGGGCDLSPVLTKLDEIEAELKKCCDRLAPFPEPSTDEYDVQLLHEGRGGIFNLPSRTFTVTVEITETPDFRKTIDPAFGERVLFCGWAWFHSQGGLCERLPLDADKKAFKPPERGENKITVSCYSGYSCRVRAWYAKANA